MRKIVMDMQSGLYAEAVRRVLIQEMDDCQVFLSDHPDHTPMCCRDNAPDTLLMEVTGYPPWQLSERLKLRDVVKARDPLCKIVLLVDENAEKEVAQQVCRAKKDGLIDNFLYGSISAAYLSAVIDTL